MRRLMVIFLVLGLAMASGISCSPTKTTGGSPGKLTVAATIFPLADIARAVGGSQVEVFTLLPPGASPHTFEATPQQGRQLSEADIFLEIGAGLDSWAGRLAQAANPDLRLVTVTEGMDLLPASPGEHEHEHEEEILGDPHIWLDPVLVEKVIAPMVCRELMESLPDQEDYFREKLREYQRELARLDREIKEAVGGFRQKKFISFHATWGYFARRYGLEERASVVEYPGKEPSARWLAALSRQIKEEGIQAVFIEPQFNPRPAELLAEETGSRVYILDPIGGEGLEGRDSYLKLMRYNLKVLEEALH
jgi:zinc transport system substrate-binding protein